MGRIPWGKTIMGNLFVPNPSQACTILDSVGNFPIVLVDGGNCTDFSKATHAEILGAKVLVIIKNAGDVRDGDYGHGTE